MGPLRFLYLGYEPDRFLSIIKRDFKWYTNYYRTLFLVSDGYPGGSFVKMGLTRDEIAAAYGKCRRMGLFNAA